MLHVSAFADGLAPEADIGGLSDVSAPAMGHATMAEDKEKDKIYEGADQRTGAGR